MEQLFFVVTRGHNGGEFLSYLINQSPDFINDPHQIEYEPYHSFLGTHWRVDDDWNLHDLGIEFMESYNLVRQQHEPPYVMDAEEFDQLLRIWNSKRSDKNLCLFMNVQDWTSACKTIGKKHKKIGSWYNLKENPARHHHIMMEFDPTSTYGDEGPNQQEYLYEFIVDEVIDWIKEDDLHNWRQFDYVFDHSRIDDIDYVLDMYAQLGVAPPSRDHISNVISAYYYKNRPQHEFCRKINQEKLHF